MIDQVVVVKVPPEPSRAVAGHLRSVPRSVPAPSGAAWVALGDSFTTGAGDVRQAGGWVARAAAALASDGLLDEVHNLARPGVRIREILADQAPLLGGRCRIVSAIGGANDVLALRWDASLFRDRLNQLLDVAASHASLVLTSTCPDFFSHRFGPHSTLSRRVGQLNEAVLTRGDGDGRLVVLDTERVP